MVKARYATGPGRGARSQAAVRYYFLRPEGGDRVMRDLVLEDGSSQPRARTGFGRLGDDLSYTEARLQALHQPAIYHYRLALSPDPEWSRQMTQPELRQWAWDVLASLGQKDGHLQWSAVVHQHPLHPHIHALVYTDSKLSRKDLQQLREEGNQALREWLREWKDLHTEPIYGQTLSAQKDPKPHGGGPALEGGEDASASSRGRKLKPQKGIDQGL